MSGQRVTIALPTMLTVDAIYDWRENADPEYAWYVVLKIGDAEIGRIFYSAGSFNRPSTAEIERIAANTLRSVMFPEILDNN